MKKNKIYFLGLFLLLCAQNLFALDVEVTNSVEDIVANKKIWLHLALGPEDVGIFKRSLQFSVDQPDLILSAWHPLDQWRPLFVPSFKKIKRMITSSFAGWLAIDFISADDVFARQLIAHTRMQISCLVLLKNGKTVPTSMVVMLNKSHAQLPKNAQPREPFVVQASNATRDSELCISQKCPAPPALDGEFDALDSLTRVWGALVGAVLSIIRFKRVLIGLLVLGFLLGGFRLRRRYWLMRRLFIMPAAWEREIYELFVLLLSGGFIYFVVPFVTRAGAFYAGSVLCFVAMIRIFMTTPFETTLWLRLKSLVGFVMGVFVLPLLLKGYLLQCGF